MSCINSDDSISFLNTDINIRTMKEMDKTIFKQIGFSDNEINVYLTMLRLGSSPVSAIAEASGIYRPYCYDTIKRLLEKGLVGFVSRQGRKYYLAADPVKLVEYEELKLEALKATLPSLRELTKRPKEETRIELYKGKEVVKIIQRDVLKTLIDTREENLVIGVDERRFMKADPVAMHQYFNQLKKHGLNEKVLVREGDNYLPGHSETTQYRFIPKEFFSPTATFIYGNKVAIIIFGEPLHAVLLESRILSESYKKQFYLIWKTAKVNVVSI